MDERTGARPKLDPPFPGEPFELAVERREPILGHLAIPRPPDLELVPRPELLGREFLRPPAHAVSDVAPLEAHLLAVPVDASNDDVRVGVTWKKKLVTDENILGGEPVFPKTRLVIRHVGAMLLRGAHDAQVREDYPYLKDEDIEFAPVYTRAYPRMGRPRERQTAAR